MTNDPASNSISDEALMRFVDGNLPPDEQSSMAAEIARDPDLTKRLEAFRFTREELVDAYAPALQVSRELMERFLGTGAGSAPPHNHTKTGPGAISVLKRLNLRRQVMAMAAAVTLLLAGASGWLLRDSLRPDYAGLVAPPQLQRALDETPSGGSAPLAGDLSVRLNSTFASLQGRWCREFTTVYSDRAQAPALACRGADGIWRIEAQEDPHDPARQSPDPQGYVPVGAGQPELVAEHRDRIMGADLSLEDEANLIKGHWKRKP